MISKFKYSLGIETSCWVLLVSAVIYNALSHLPTYPHFLEVLLPAAIYLISHLFRAIRLWLVLFEERLSWRYLFGLYAATSCASMTVPFKMGDALKISEISCVIGSLQKGIIIQIVERFFDVAVLLIMGVTSLLLGQGSLLGDREKEPLLVLILIIVFGILAIAYFTIPSFVNYGRHIIVLRSRSTYGLRALALLEQIEEIYAGVMNMIQGRKGMLLLVSLLIWIFELLASYLLFIAFTKGSFADSFSNLFTFLNVSFLGTNINADQRPSFPWVLGFYSLIIFPFCLYYFRARFKLLQTKRSESLYRGKPYTMILNT